MLNCVYICLLRYEPLEGRSYVLFFFLPTRYHSARHTACVRQCFLACSFCRKGRERKQAGKKELLRGKAAGKFSGAGGNQERVWSSWGCTAVSLQMVTAREHSAPRQRVCRALALAQPSSAQPRLPLLLATPQWSVGIWMRLSPCLRHFAILGLIKTPRTVWTPH